MFWQSTCECWKAKCMVKKRGYCVLHIPIKRSNLCMVFTCSKIALFFNTIWFYITIYINLYRHYSQYYNFFISINTTLDSQYSCDSIKNLQLKWYSHSWKSENKATGTLYPFTFTLTLEWFGLEFYMLLESKSFSFWGGMAIPWTGVLDQLWGARKVTECI